LNFIPPFSSRNHAWRSQHKTAAFTLIELLAVIGIIVIVMALVGPAMNALKTSGDITSAAYDIAGTLEAARAHALAKNTYTWVGFYEEDANSQKPTSAEPPYPGKGKVVLATIASKDGTTIVDDDDSGNVTLDPARFEVILKPTKITGVHLTDVDPPPASPTNPRSDSLDARSRLPFDASLQGPVTSQNRISSDASEKTRRPFVVQGYTFHKSVRFSPRGEVNINSTYKERRVGEIGLRPAHGPTVDTKTPNVVAIQFTGIGGKINIYRR
jgi:type II secretory pathway pseudopilin PulG